MSNSTHKVEVVRVGKLEKHPNADSLSIVRVFSGYQVVVKTSDWQEGDLAAYIPPDTLVPTDRPEFAFLKERPESPKGIDGRSYHRLKAIKLRKEYSMGMLVPVPNVPGGRIVGVDLASYFEAKHYVPEPRQSRENTSQKTTYGSRAEEAPQTSYGKPPMYDLEALRRFGDIFEEGEHVVVTEKIHGANGRYTYGDRGLWSWSLGYRGNFSLRVGSYELSRSKVSGFKVKKLDPMFRTLRVGSRNQWKRPDSNDIWWRVALKYPQIAAYLKLRNGAVLYGEVYGDVQDLDYGLPAGEVDFRAFDILDEDGDWMSWPVFKAACERWKIPYVPVIGEFPFKLDDILALAEGKSLIAPKQIREGIVVKPERERRHPRLGRVALKAVGNGYLERAA